MEAVLSPIVCRERTKLLSAYAKAALGYSDDMRDLSRQGG
jgi:hypothetical protein